MLLPGPLRARGREARWLIAAIAGVLAAAGPGRPTGNAIADLVFKAAVAILIVHLGSRAKLSVLAAMSVAAAVVAIGSSGQIPAHAAVGLSAALLLTVRRTPVGAALVSLGLAVAAFRLDRLEEPFGLSAVLAAALLVAVGTSGFLRSRRHVQRRLLIGGLVVVGTALLFSAVAGLSAWRARAPISTATAAARNGLDAARAGDQERFRHQFSTAASGFADAANLLDVWWNRPARLVPVVGQHLALATDASRAGEHLATVALSAGTATDLDEIGVVDGQVDLRTLASLEEPLEATASAATEATSRIDRSRSGWIVPPMRRRVARERARLVSAQRDAATALDAVQVLPSLLGAEGERRYFVAIQTPSEARGTGGFIGSFAEITATAGRLHLERIGRTHDLNEGGEMQRMLDAPADYAARYARFDPNLLWQNVTMSPDFPTVATVIERQYPRSGGRDVDGVIAIDPDAVAALLELTGPVDVAPWPEPLSSSNARQVLLFDQYVQLDGQARVDFLGDVVDAVWGRLTSGRLASPRRLADVLAPIVRSKHLMMSSRAPRESTVLRRYGFDGAMTPITTDGIGVVTQNASGNKIDWFLRRSIEYRARIDRSRRMDAVVRVRLENLAPSAGLPDYVIGNALTPKLPTGTNKTYVSIYTPSSLVRATIDGAPLLLESERELGRNVYSAYVLIPAGTAANLELELDGTLPAGDYELAFHQQPTVVPDHVDVEVRRSGEEIVSWRGALDRDRSFGS